MRKNRFRFSFKEHLSIFLIFCLLISQTIQVSFFDSIEAAVDDYRDLVSILVDRETYSKQSVKIKRYSEDIQSYLGNTRVSLFIVDGNTPPSALASQNEKLYYDGDGKRGITSLVGTILIGNIPIPMAHREGKSFPSLYPYVDFDDKRFVYSDLTRRYEYANGTRETTDVDIWHGVINPSIGRVWNGEKDIDTIGAFLDKTHDFYTKKGKFVPSTLPPRVFYYDGYNESRALNPRTLYQYSLSIANAENFAYKRFTKYLLKDINTQLARYDVATKDTALMDFIDSIGLPSGGADTLSDDTIRDIPDIQTARPIGGLVKKLYEVLNKKTLSDEQLFVHNAGRYNKGSTVNIDQPTIQGTLMDEVALSILKEGNAAMENAIDEQIRSANLARKLYIFDRITRGSKSYNGYFFGKESSSIASPDQCTIARGFSGTDDPFGQSVRVEANVAYDITTTEAHANLLKKDTEELVPIHRSAAYSCFDPANGTPKLQAYWGGNSLLRVAIPGYDATKVLSNDIISDIRGFSQPIFSLGGMRETSRLKNPSLADCQDTGYQYALLAPYTYTYTDQGDGYGGPGPTCTVGWPKEWNTANGSCPEDLAGRALRYSCLTEHEVLGNIPTVVQSISDYKTKACFAGSLSLDGRVVRSGTNKCTETRGSGEDQQEIDTTTYEDRAYHSIPSLWKHISPTSDEISAAEKNGVTPSIPVDIERSFEFITPKGNRARFTYPDFFRSPATDIPTMRLWLKVFSESQWKKVIDTDTLTNLSPDQIEANGYIGAAPLPVNPIDWNVLISDAALEKIIQAKNWMHPDVSEKIKKIVETSLSYSHEYGGDPSKNPPRLPPTGSGYDIAYLGLTSLIPLGESTETDSLQNDYTTQIAALQALNMGEDGVAGKESEYKASAQCGPPDGVMIFQWPSAIMCWISTLLPPRISAGSCGGSTIGNQKSERTSFSLDQDTRNSPVESKKIYDSARLIFAIEKTIMLPGESQNLSYDFVTSNGSHIELPIESRVQLDIISLESSGALVARDRWNEYLEVSPSVGPYGDRGAQFNILSHDKFLKGVIRATLFIPLSDGTEYRSVSQDLTLRVSDEYIDVSPTLDGVGVSTIDTTSISPVKLNLSVRTTQGENIKANLPYTLAIYDSFDGTLIESGITILNNEYTLSYTYSKKIGTYRFVLTDAAGHQGESTLVVTSGPLDRATFTPISSAIVMGSDSLGILRLTDKLGNILTPELHNIDVTVRGGYVIDREGNHREKLHLDSIESELILSYGALESGVLSLTMTIDGTVQLISSIDILSKARVVLERSKKPEVAGDPITVRLKVFGQDDALVSGFSSVAVLTLPESAGYFSVGPSVEIVNGLSKDFLFYPGRVSGDHSLSLDIPGIGKISDIVFSIDPGIPMYMTPNITDSVFSFTLRDRYGNISPKNYPGKLTRNAEAEKSINFANGIYSESRSPGYYTLRSPTLANNTIKYRDTSGEYTLTGISYASIYVPPTQTDFTFLPDYNARYTVLAGGTFLRQGEQILYASGKTSSSLAVSTLLDSPYQRDSLLRVSPSGSIDIGQTLESSIDSHVSIEQRNLVVTVRDEVTHTDIARVGYPILESELSYCHENEGEKFCPTYFERGHIALIGYDNTVYTGSLRGDELTLGTPTTNLIQYRRGYGWTLAGGVTVSLENSSESPHLLVSVNYNGSKIGQIIVATERTKSVLRSSDISTPRATSTPILSDKVLGYSIEESYDTVFDPLVHGYSILASSTTQQLDEERIGPNHIDSIGSLDELPGVGWRGKNRLLLSYSAGDTVGESSRWFHTYTYVNLGDPVAHIDHGAPGTQIDGIDRSIGTQIASDAHGSIRSYTHKDMNHDGFEDIVIIYEDGFIELLVNGGGSFRSKKMIAYIPDLGTRGISLGDFRGDGYADIISLDGSGSLILLDNDFRRLTRLPIRIDDPDVLSPPAGITQFQIYDMDHDDRDDIVILTEKGELSILYGTPEGGGFTQKILDKTLGISLSSENNPYGGVFTADVIPQLGDIHLPTTGTGIDDATLQSEVYYQRQVENVARPGTFRENDLLVTDPTLINSILSTNLVDPNTSESPTLRRTYIKSEYASAYGVEIEKSYTNLAGSILHAGDTVEADISIKNTTAKKISNTEYLDTIPEIFDRANTKKYTLVLDGKSEEREFHPLSDDYDALFRLIDIPPGATLHILYEVEALPASYGKMVVDRLEGGEVGDDLYGDVGFETSTTCGASMILWRSIAVRAYQRGTRDFTPAEIPASIQSRITDADKNGTPDSIENMSLADRKKAYETLGNGTNLSSDSRNLIHADVAGNGNVLDIGLSDRSITEITDIAQNLADGLSCGFGGGSCMNFPINWAPLAPGSVPSVFGMPLGNLTPSTGVPIFSALTGIPIYGPWGCFPIPAIYPASPIGLENTCSSNLPNAGGILGTTSPANSIRIYVTPTLTLGMGEAICFGGPAIVAGNSLPMGVSPLIPGGNCIVMAHPMPFCKGDGSSSDGDIRGVSGLGGVTQAWNSESCKIQATTTTKTRDKDLDTDIISYLKSKDTSRLNAIYSNLAKRGPRTLSGGPAMTIGGGGDGEVSIEIDAKKPFSFGNIVKVKNIRVAAFPDFIMNWVARQTDEITNKLFSLPNLIIIPPTDLGPNAQIDGTPESAKKLLSDAIDGASTEKLSREMKGAFDATNVTQPFIQKTGTQYKPGSDLAGSLGSSTKSYDTWLDKKVSENSSTINSVQGSANALKMAYKSIGQWPFLRINHTSVSVNVPWPLPQELDKYARSLDQYTQEIANMKKSWCDGKADPNCIAGKASADLGAFQASLQRNLKVLESYRRFPEKIQKYVTWRQRYTAWGLCNIDTIQQFSGKWLKENGVRFQKWAEFYVLMTAIVKSWQPIIDIFRDADAQCAVCQNQRYSLDYFKFKLLSALIPSLPIIVFPKWPDVVLDLSDVRMGININVPDFDFRVTPLRLPNLPSLSLPSSPTLSLSLPGFLTLPPIPDLPDLPDLPSLPRISLPPLPPPPKLPKIFGAVSIVTNMIKLFQKVKCIYQKSFLIPEWQVGDVIAQRTARQGTLPFDFLNLQFPQFSLPSIREIRVQSHVNFELQSDFITEFARSAVKPINQFNTDLGRSIPSKVGEDVNISTPPNIQVKVQGFLDTQDSLSGSLLKMMIASLEKESSQMMDTTEFIPYFRDQLIQSGQSPLSFDKSIEKSHIESEKVTREIEQNTIEQGRLLQKYFEAEAAKTKKIEHLLEKMQQPDILLTENTLPTATFVSEENDLVSGPLARYTSFVDASMHIQDISTPRGGDTSLTRETQSLQNKLSRLAANDPGVVTPEAGGTSADGYAPRFEGIYILTPESHVQTRLFDYVEPLQGDETIDVLDIDQDGDLDYLYLMDGALYLKSSHSKEPSRQKDTTLSITDLDTTLSPEAPNFFHELIASPGQIQIDFSSARSTDTAYRLEFFDHYTEWDLTRIGIHDEISVARTTIDLLAEDTSRDSTSDGVHVHPFSRFLDSVQGTSGFTIEGPKMTSLTSGKPFTLIGSKPFYTGKASTRLQYSASGNSTEEINLKPYSRYTFDYALSGTLLSGKIYFFDPLSIEKTSYSDDLIGIPILEGTSLVNLDGKFTIRDTTGGSPLTIESGGQYRVIGLGKQQDRYSIGIPYENGFYSARLSSYGSMLHAGITLLAPQAGLDQGAPIIDLDDTIRVPVYQKKKYLLSDIIHDQSRYTLMADMDVTQDENEDGIYDNDFMMSNSGLLITESTLEFGPFDTLDPRLVVLKAQDEYRNTLFFPLRVEVYAPIPQIESVSSTGMLSGLVGGNQFDEPVHFLRVRPGTPIDMISPRPVISENNGYFSTGSLFTGSGAQLSYSGGTVMIDESTGLPHGNTSLRIQILPANATNPMRLQYLNIANQLLFEQFLILPPSIPIVQSAGSRSGAYLQVLSNIGYKTISATLKDPGIPGGAYIVDEKGNPKLAIASDGNIYTLDQRIVLTPTSHDGFLNIEISDGTTSIANIVYHIDFYYTLK